MSDLDLSLTGLHGAVAAFLAAADAAGAKWTDPRVPGKWSPSQIGEHVTRIMEESAAVVSGAPSKFPTIPIVLRPIVRVLVFRRVLRRNAFFKMRAVEAFDPAAGSATPVEGRVRLEEVLVRFNQACRGRAASGQDVASTIFGAVSVADFAKFQELHVRHHLQQITGIA